MKISRKICQLILVLSFLCFVGCEKEADITNAKLTGSLSKGSYTWMYTFNSEFDIASAFSHLKKLNIANVFMAINTRQLKPLGPSAGEKYTTNFKAFLDLAEDEGVAIHLNMLYVNDYTYEENHQQGLDRIRYFVDFLNENPKYINHPIQGIHIDIEPYALEEWDNTSDWDVKNSLMAEYLSFLEKAHKYMKGDSLYDEGKLPWVTISVAIAEHLDSKFRDGLLPNGDTELFEKYADFVVPMVYFSNSSASKYNLDEKTDMVYKYSNDEVNTLPSVVGVNVSNFDTFHDILKLEEDLSDKFSGNENFLGVCFFKFETLFAKFEQ